MKYSEGQLVLQNQVLVALAEVGPMTVKAIAGQVGKKDTPWLRTNIQFLMRDQLVEPVRTFTYRNILVTEYGLTDEGWETAGKLMA